MSTAVLLSSHEAHVAFGFPTFFRLKPAAQKQKKKGNDHRCLNMPLGLDSVADLMANRNDNTVTEESYPQAFSFFLRLAARDASSSCLRRTKSRHSTAWAILTPSCFQGGSREEIHEWTETRSRQPSCRHSWRWAVKNEASFFQNTPTKKHLQYKTKIHTQCLNKQDKRRMWQDQTLKLARWITDKSWNWERLRLKLKCISKEYLFRKTHPSPFQLLFALT